MHVFFELFLLLPFKVLNLYWANSLHMNDLLILVGLILRDLVLVVIIECLVNHIIIHHIICICFLGLHILSQLFLVLIQFDFLIVLIVVLNVLMVTLELLWSLVGWFHWLILGEVMLIVLEWELKDFIWFVKWFLKAFTQSTSYHVFLRIIDVLPLDLRNHWAFITLS